MFNENIINLSFCIIIKMPAFRVDKFSAGRTKCKSPMLKRTWWNSLALFQIVNLKGVLKPNLGLDLIDPRSSYTLTCSCSSGCLWTWCCFYFLLYPSQNLKHTKYDEKLQPNMSSSGPGQVQVQVRSRSGPRSGPEGPRTKDQRPGPGLTLNFVCHHHHH